MDLERELRNTLKPILAAEPPAALIERATQDLPPPKRVFQPWLARAATAGVVVVIVAVLALSWPASPSGPPGTSSTSAAAVATSATSNPPPDATLNNTTPPSQASPDPTLQPTPSVTVRPLSDLERSDAFWVR